MESHLNRYFAAIACFSLAHCISGWTVTGTWTGGGMPNNVWNVPANWSSNPSFPNGTNDQATFNGSNPTTLSLGAPITIGTLEFITAGTYTIQDAMNTLTFNASSGTATLEGGLGAGNSIINTPIVLNSTLRYIVQLPTTITISGNISGPQGLFTDAGTLVLAGTNTYMGQTQINQGTITVTGSLIGQVTIENGTLGLSGAGTLASSSTVAMSGPDAIFDISSASGNRTIGALFGSGQVLLGANTLTVNIPNDSALYEGTILDGGAGGGFTKAGSGLLVLSGLTNYLGATTIVAGTLELDIINAIPNSAQVIVNSGALFNLNGFDQTIQDLTGSGLIFLGGATLTVNPASSSTTFSGVISESGSLVKQGSNTLVLSGANTYTGSTSINGGTLRMGIVDGIADSSGVAVAAGATFDLNGFTQHIQDLSGAGQVTLGSLTNLFVNPLSDSVTFSGTISGPGTSGVVKEGASQLILSGMNTYTGDTAVNGGNLTINGSLASGEVAVGAFASLSGTGTIQGLVALEADSLLVPGNLTGTPLTSDSTLFQTGSQYLAIIDSAGQSTRLLSTGAGGINVSPGSNLFVVPEQGVYEDGTSYPILQTTTGTISNGTSFSIFSSNPKFQFSLVEDLSMHTVFLVLESGATLFRIPTENLSGNRLATANYLNTLDAYLPLDPILADFISLTSQETENALDAISPARNAFSTFASEWTAFTLNNIIESRIADRRLVRAVINEKLNSFSDNLVTMAFPYPLYKRLNSKGPEENSEVYDPLLLKGYSEADRYSVWGAPFGEFIQQKSQSQTPGFDLKAGGLLLGFDAFDFEHALVGFSLGYAYLHLEEDHQFGKAWMNDYLAAFYSSFFGSNAYFDLALWGGYHQTHNQRNIAFSDFNATARSDSHGWQFVPHFELGYDVFSGCVAWEPFIRFDWAVNFEDDVTEQGASPLNMHQESLTSALMRIEFGLASYQTKRFENGSIFMAKESLSYVYKKPLGNTGQITAAIVGAPGGTFTVETLTESQNLIAPGFELFYRMRNGFFITLDYQGEFSGPFKSNTIVLKTGIEF